MITAETRLVALLGQPVAGSLSPRMQNAAFAARGLDWAYIALDVAPAELETVLRGLAAAGFAGANVTAPHKLAAAALSETDLESVNTLLFDAGTMRGYSTDAAILDGIASERAVVIGAGGAGRAFSEALPGSHTYARRGDWPPEAADADLVVNATPVRDEALVELSARQTLIDLPYPDTATAAAARAAGARVIGGLEVLVAQGGAAFELWTGVPAPIGVMRRAVGLRA
jgi:shikimate dehydrogenase